MVGTEKFTLNDLKKEIDELKKDKHWEAAGEFISGMNKNVIEKIVAAKGEDEFSPLLFDYAPHAVLQCRAAIKRAKSNK